MMFQHVLLILNYIHRYAEYTVRVQVSHTRKMTSFANLWENQIQIMNL